MEKQKIMVMQMIYGALMMSTLIYGYVAFMFTQKADPALTSSMQNPLLVPMLAASIVLWGMAWYLPRNMLQGMSRDLQKQRMTFDLDINRFTVPLILRAAFLEAPVVLGLIVVMRSSDMNAFAIFWAPTFLGFLLSFPTANKMQSNLDGSRWNTAKRF